MKFFASMKSFSRKTLSYFSDAVNERFSCALFIYYPKDFGSDARRERKMPEGAPPA
jgi:hypothetical protein